jgi:enamine deaminase RidA (YjgF/YER057c/UK114 family)
MAIQKINADALPKPHGFAHAVVATGATTVYTSGVVGIDADENLAGGDRDYRAQAYQATKNAYAALAAAGASPADVVRLMLYVVDPTQENLDEVYAGFGKAVGDGGGKSTAMTLIGTSGLSLTGAVVEIDATALID